MERKHSHRKIQQPQSDCADCKKVEQDSQDESSSSDDDMSHSISIPYNSNMIQFQKESPALKVLQSQFRQLKEQNIQLRSRNSQLMARLSQNHIQKHLKKKLKQKQEEINMLKMQINSNYYSMNTNSRKNQFSPMNTLRNIDIEQKKYKLRSKSSRGLQFKSNKSKQSSEDQTDSVRLHIFQKNKMYDQLKAAKLTLEKQLYESKERLLLCENQLRWMCSLANKMIGMSDKLGLLFKQKISQSRWSFKKKAKVSWRYVKHVLKYLLVID